MNNLNIVTRLTVICKIGFCILQRCENVEFIFIYLFIFGYIICSVIIQRFYFTYYLLIRTKILGH
jgi:hypothetical protein